jgi:hypothetical protein
MELNEINTFPGLDWITLNKKTILDCKEYANNSNSKGFYIRKRNADPDKVKSQIFQGKLAEFGVAFVLINYFSFPADIKPDLNIYKTNQKSWAADLPYACTYPKYPNVSVKCCSLDSAKRYGESYVFELKDKLFQDKDSADYVAFVLLDEKTQKCKVRAIVSWKYLIDKNLLKEMKLAIHRGKKVAIYMEDIYL